MSKTIYLLFFILASLPSIAQKRITIVYKSSIYFEKADFQKYIDKEVNELGIAQSDSLKKIANEIMEDYLNGLDSLINKNPSDSLMMHVYRENDEVVIKNLGGSPKGRAGFRYNTKTLMLTRIDSVTYGKIDSVIVTKSMLTDTLILSNRMEYTVQFTKEIKTVLQYKCQKIIVTAISKTSSGISDSTQYEIWATKVIKPAISVNAVLLFRKAILTEFTPLEVKEIMGVATNSYHLTSATEIRTDKK